MVGCVSFRESFFYHYGSADRRSAGETTKKAKTQTSGKRDTRKIEEMGVASSRPDAQTISGRRKGYLGNRLFNLDN